MLINFLLIIVFILGQNFCGLMAAQSSDISQISVSVVTEAEDFDKYGSFNVVVLPYAEAVAPKDNIVMNCVMQKIYVDGQDWANSAALVGWRADQDCVAKLLLDVIDSDKMDEKIFGINNKWAYCIGHPYIGGIRFAMLARAVFESAGKLDREFFIDIYKDLMILLQDHGAKTIILTPPPMPTGMDFDAFCEFLTSVLNSVIDLRYLKRDVFFVCHGMSWVKCLRDLLLQKQATTGSYKKVSLLFDMTKATPQISTCGNNEFLSFYISEGAERFLYSIISNPIEFRKAYEPYFMNP